MPLQSNKDTIYIDVDDEITTIIDKVRSSSGRIVALVLPKRATVFQSIVNMKLLKRTAENARKNVVLVTNEASLLPLAGAVGLHVASTPQSRPEIPSAGPASAAADELADETGNDGVTVANSGNRTVGELAGSLAPASEVETLNMPDDEQTETVEDMAAEAPMKTKRIKVPNFNKFRMLLLLGVLVLVGIVVGLYFCLAVLPKATIDIATKTSSVNVNTTAALNPSAQVLDTSKSVLPAKIEQQQKTTTQQVQTTGQKNTGTTATGSVTMTACEPNLGYPQDVPAGTGISVNGLTFITQADTAFSHKPSGNNGSCISYNAVGDTAITAQNAGAKYNTANASFTVAGRSDVTGTGSASGGTDNIIHIVAQADIDSAKQKLSSADNSSVKDTLEQALRQDGRYPLPATFNAGAPVITTSNNAGDQADTVTVTQAITYTMYGANRDDLVSLIKAKISNQVDTNGQAIVSDGLDASTVQVTDTTNGIDTISLQTTATVGPQLKADTIIKAIAGKRAGDVRAYVGSLPGVTKVDVNLSPFWVSSVPTDPKKVTVKIHGTN